MVLFSVAFLLMSLSKSMSPGPKKDTPFEETACRLVGSQVGDLQAAAHVVESEPEEMGGR